MKIFCDLQLSFIDKKTGKFKVDNDSNFNFMKNMLQSIYHIDNTMEFVLALPMVANIEGSLTDLLCQLPSKTDPIFVDYSNNYLLSRYLFPYDQMCSLITEIKPDVIWTNDFANVKNYKLIDKFSRVVAYNHWIDNPIYPKVDNQYTYLFRQAEGAFHADLIMFNSIYGKQFFCEGLRYYFNDDFVSHMSNKTLIIPPLLDIAFINLHKSQNKFEKTTLVFNHRLSSLKYYASNFELFNKACKLLQNTYDFDIICTNPSGYDIDIPSYMKIVNSTRYRDYINLLSKCHFGGAFFLEGHGQWSMSLAELAALGILFVLPKKFGYPEIVPDDYPYLYETFEEGVNKMELLFNTSQGISKSLIDYAGKHYSVESGAKSFIHWLQKG